MKPAYNHALSKLLRNRGMTQLEFAAAVEIHYVTVSNILHLKRDPTIEQRERIARFFGKEEEAIFGKEKVKTATMEHQLLTEKEQKNGN